MTETIRRVSSDKNTKSIGPLWLLPNLSLSQKITPRLFCNSTLFWLISVWKKDPYNLSYTYISLWIVWYVNPGGWFYSQSNRCHEQKSLLPRDILFLLWKSHVPVPSHERRKRGGESQRRLIWFFSFTHFLFIDVSSSPICHKHWKLPL